MFGKQILFILFFTSLLFCANAQVSFKATISPNTVAQDQYLTYRLVIENASTITNIELPNLNDFTIVSGPNKEQGENTINGKSSNYLALSYILLPKKKGKFQIEGTSATVNGESRNTGEIFVNVTSPKGGNNSPQNNIPSISVIDPFAPQNQRSVINDYVLKPGEDIRNKISKNLEFRLNTNKTTCYVGEAIKASYILYSRLRTQTKLSKNPSFNGFSVIEIPPGDPMNAPTERRNGIDFNAYEIRTAQLYPLQPGDFTLEAATVDNVVEFLADSKSASGPNVDSWFDDPGTVIHQNISLNSNTETIHVKPLPEIGKPNSFKGAVGKFTLNVKIDQTNFSTDDLGKLIFTIGGEGNFSMIATPEISWPSGIDGFDSNSKELLNNYVIPVSGSKEFTFPFSANKSGQYTIPSQEFSFFNPETGSYKILKSEPINIFVKQGTGHKNFDTAAIERTNALNNNPIKKFFNNRPLVAGTAVALILAALGIGFAMRKKKNEEINLIEEVIPKEKEIISFGNPLSETEKCLFQPGCENFFETLNEEFKSYLSTSLNIPRHDIQAKNVVSSLDKLCKGDDICLKTADFLNDIEFQLYTPQSDQSNFSSYYDQAKKLIASIDEKVNADDAKG